MRPLVTAFLVVLAFAAFFVGVGAVGVWGLYRQQVAIAPPAYPRPVLEDADEGDSSAVVAEAGRVDPASPALPPPPGRPDPFAPAPPGRPGVADGPAPMPPPVARPPPAVGPIDLPALAAVTHGKMIRVEPVTGGYAVAEWTDPAAYVEWPVPPRAPGWYHVELSVACGDGAGGGFVVAVANQTVNGRARPTGGWRNYHTTTLGPIHLTPDDTRLLVRPAGEIASALMNVRHVRLVPAP